MKKVTTLVAYLTLALTASELHGQIALGDDRIVLTNERRVNSSELEYSPVFYKDGIVFVTTRSENLLYNNIIDKRSGTRLMSMFWSIVFKMTV